MGYRKKKPGKSTPLLWLHFSIIGILNTLYNRYRSYNRTLELLEKWRGRTYFVIRPEIPTVGRAEANKEKLMAFYQHGYDVMKDHYRGTAGVPKQVTGSHRTSLGKQARGHVNT